MEISVGAEFGMMRKQDFGLLLDCFSYAGSILFVDDIGAGLRRCVVGVICRGVLTVLGAEVGAIFGAAVTGERLAGKSGATVPACGDGVLGRGRDDDVRGGGLGSGCRFVAAFAVFRERLAGKNDGLGAGFRRVVVGGGVVYAVEGSSGSEAARNAGVAAAAVSAIATVAVIAIAAPTIVAVTAVIAIISPVAISAVDGFLSVAGRFG